MPLLSKIWLLKKPGSPFLRRIRGARRTAKPSPDSLFNEATLFENIVANYNETNNPPPCNLNQHPLMISFVTVSAK